MKYNAIQKKSLTLILSNCLLLFFLRNFSLRILVMFQIGNCGFSYILSNCVGRQMPECQFPEYNFSRSPIARTPIYRIGLFPETSIFPNANIPNAIFPNIQYPESHYPESQNPEWTFSRNLYKIREK